MRAVVQHGLGHYLDLVILASTFRRSSELHDRVMLPLRAPAIVMACSTTGSTQLYKEYVP